MSIHDDIMERLREHLQAAMIDDLAVDDTSRAGIVKIGPVQGDPTPEEARISITIHENDPDRIAKGGATGMTEDFSDELEEAEVGGAVTMVRRFTVKGRCLFVRTREDEITSRTIASAVRQRMERTILTTPFTGVKSDTEYVSRRAMSSDLRGEMLQSGGPPDAFDYIIKIHFSVLTTQTGISS